MLFEMHCYQDLHRYPYYAPLKPSVFFTGFVDSVLHIGGSNVICFFFQSITTVSHGHFVKGIIEHNQIIIVIAKYDNIFRLAAGKGEHA